MKSLDKLAQRICLALLLLPVAWVALVVLSFFWDSMAMERFYRNRPILQAMRMAQEDDHASVESAAAAEALLRHVVADTDAKSAIAALAGEGFSCEKQPPSSSEHVACGVQVSGTFGYTDWSVNLQFGGAFRGAQGREGCGAMDT